MATRRRRRGPTHGRHTRLDPAHARDVRPAARRRRHLCGGGGGAGSAEVRDGGGGRGGGGGAIVWRGAVAVEARDLHAYMGAHTSFSKYP